MAGRRKAACAGSARSAIRRQEAPPNDLDPGEALEDAALREARRRGYLRSGLCPGGFGPLIKTVVAVTGQRVAVTDLVAIDGVPIRNSRIFEKDGQGRSLRHGQSGMLLPGEVYLHSDFIGSWDSRYFGPVPDSGVLGLAQEVLTYAP